MHECVRLAAATMDDAPAVAEVLDACTRHFLGRPSSVDDARDRLREGQPFLAFLRDEPVGFGHVWVASPAEMRAYVRVRPASREQRVGTALLAQIETTARHLADGRRTLTLTSWAGDEQAESLLSGVGFSPVRYFLQMRVELTRAAGPSALPEGVRLRRFASGPDDGAMFSVFAESFADHWGSEAFDKGQWWAENRDGPGAGFDPALWTLAEAGSRPVGFSIARELERDGETIGWISLLGVVPAWRGRGLGEALLTRGLVTFRERGRRHAALDVDAENLSGALRLYRKVGMGAVPAFTVWSKPL
jgi:mycothiol synthase